jgi:hypothetical protein
MKRTSLLELLLEKNISHNVFSEEIVPRGAKANGPHERPVQGVLPSTAGSAVTNFSSGVGQ